ncbi:MULTISPECIES: DUF3987 domain-containing protein [unclassified Rhodanobacter]|uniref:DUF3987 domain-containing protein n=1 Tax=unclassified Rhodanobacter TaxID=2621553 RepID=UPI000400A516|nr:MULTISPECIES: DUF3987 domain-containing protein [unclassified Rhodanobacter]
MGKFRASVSDLKPKKKVKKPAGFTKYLIDNKTHIDEMKGWLTYEKPIKESERIWAVVPPASGLEKVLQAFQAATDSPLELCLMSYFHFVSGYLLKGGVTYGSEELGDGFIPFLWNIVVADSGAAKSFSVTKLAKYSNVKCNFLEVASGAKFFEHLKDLLDKDGYALWFLDECAQFLKGCQQMGHPLFEIKSYLLKMYSQDPITRSTKKGGDLVIEKPVMSILGMNTVESFIKSIDEESLTDGFCQRFGLIRAKPDPEREIKDYPLYNYKEMDGYLIDAFKKIDELELNGKNFWFTKDAELLFKMGFQQHFSKKIPGSFYRRNLFKAFSYAVIYHVILGKENLEIDAEDMAWALRMVEIHLNDIFLIIGTDVVDDLKKKVEHTKSLEKRLSEKGKNIRPSDVVHSVRGIENKDQAIVVMKLAGIIENGE